LSKLKCRYINYHPSLLISPVKEEIAFDNPKIWLYHDVITERQIETFKKLGAPKVNQGYY
jgi:prolyl 4-hydroxylase